MNDVFVGTQRVRDPFHRIVLAMRPVIHRVNVPFVPRAMVRHIHDAVHDRIAQQDVRVLHVNFRAQNAAAFLELSVFHPFEQIKVFFHRTVAVRRIHAGLQRGRSLAPFGTLGKRAAGGAHFLLSLIIHISQSHFHQSDRPCVEQIEVIRGKSHFSPLNPQPGCIFLDCFDKFCFLFGRVGIVKPQVQFAAEFLCGKVIDQERFAVSNVQVAVRFGRQAGAHIVKASIF